MAIAVLLNTSTDALDFDLAQVSPDCRWQLRFASAAATLGSGAPAVRVPGRSLAIATGT